MFFQTTAFYKQVEGLELVTINMNKWKVKIVILIYNQLQFDPKIQHFEQFSSK